MPNQAPNFALPGLLHIDRPELDRQREMIRLTPKRVQDTNWLGIPSVGPVTPGGTQPPYPLASVAMVFGHSLPVGDEPLFVLSSSPAAGQGLVVIDNNPTWLFHVPVQPLPLTVLDNYVWEIQTTDTSGVTTVYYAGTQMITP